MSDDIIKRLREAIAAGPTVGPWTMLPACAGEQCVARINSWEAVPPNGVELAHDSIDANYIAAASPDNITTLLDRLDAAEAENERLREDARRYQYILDCEVCAVKAFLPDIDPDAYREKVRAKHDAELAALAAQQGGDDE